MYDTMYDEQSGTFDESPSNEFMMDSSDGGKVQGIERYSPNKQREQALIDACYNAGLQRG